MAQNRNELRTKISLTVATFGLLGNVGLWMTGISWIATNPSGWALGVFFLLLSVVSFYCAWVVRKNAVSELSGLPESNATGKS